jgi:hypothetical protein
MAGDGPATINISKAHSLLGLLVAIAGCVFVYARTDNLAGGAKEDAARAHGRADAAYAKAEGAEALAREKGEKAAEALSSVNVKLARMETMLEQLVNESRELKGTVKAIQDARIIKDAASGAR